MEILYFVKEWSSILNLVIFPAIWWAATITAKVNALHKGFSIVQALRAKVTVLEERTGGEIKVMRNGT